MYHAPNVRWFMDDLLSVFMEHVCACVDFYCLYFGWRLPLETKCSRSAKKFLFLNRLELLLTWREMNASYCLVVSSMHRSEGEASPTPTRTVCVCCCGERCTKRDGPAVRLWISPPCSQVPHADTGTDAHSEHRFPAPSLKLGHI